MYLKMIPLVFAALTASSVSAKMPMECKEQLLGRASTILVGSSAGGGQDLYARAIASVFSEITGMETRVVNQSGKVARSLAANATDKDLTLLFAISSTLGLDPVPKDPSKSLLSMFDTLGFIHHDDNVWLTRENINLEDVELKELVVSASTIDNALYRLILAGKSLGINVRVVSGYSGSSELVSAILRDEVDATTLSTETASKVIENGGITVGLTLSAGSSLVFSSTPYLVGEGGLLELRAEGLPNEEVQVRKFYADLALALSASDRGLFISRNVPESIRKCIKAGVEEAFLSDKLKNSLLTLGRPVSPILGYEAEKISEMIIRSYHDSRPLIEELLAEQGGN